MELGKVTIKLQIRRRQPLSAPEGVGHIFAKIQLHFSMKQRYLSWVRTLWVLALLLGGSLVLEAQTTIRGTITDADGGDPLIGANVLVEGTSTGTVTDFDGNFELTVPTGASALRVSYTGYASQTVPLVAGQTVYNLEMSAGESLQEVVVVGYGTQSQQEVTSAVTSVKEEDFNQGVVNNPTQLVQGKVAGLQIATPGGDPNQTPTIRLRGLSTLGANTEPLVIIDGVIGASLNTVDPSDIASFDVLKDGSAAAIYGTRASSGVIIVTTKKGTKGKTTVDYRVQGGVEAFGRGVEVASADRFRELRPDAFDGGENNDWYDELTRTAFSQVHNIGIGGGLGTGSYRASLNYRDVEGVANWSGFNQLNGRVNINQSALDNKLKFDFTAAANSRQSDFGFNDAFRYAVIYNPTIPARATSVPAGANYTLVGGYTRVDQFDDFNPVAINEQNSNTGLNREQLVSGRVSYQPIEGLDIAAFFARNVTNNQFDTYFSKTSQFIGRDFNGRGQRTTEEFRNDLFELTANYNWEFSNNSSLKFLAGYSYQDLETDRLFVRGDQSISDVFGVNGFGFYNGFANGNSAVSSGGDRSELESFFGRVSLDYDNIFFASASLRSDGSTRFGADEKRGLFPAVSAGVNLAGFLNQADINTVKLRAGYGVTGNIPGQSNLSTRLFSQAGSFFFNGEYVPAYSISRNDNPALRFERKGELNVGLDLAFFDYKLTAAIDYFNRRTTDLIFNVPVSIGASNPITGESYTASSIFANLDDVAFVNRGIEVAVGYDVANSDRFSYRPSLVFSTITTILDSVDVENPDFPFFTGGAREQYQASTSPGAPGQNNAPTQVIRAGQELGQIYTYVFQGIADNGDYEFQDLNGDGSITFSSEASPDKQVVGNGLPDWTLGFQNEFRFGNFDASAFFRGAFGHSLANMPRNFYENTSPTRGTDNVVVTDNFDPNLRPEVLRFNSLYVERADFIVLDNASIGYRVPLAANSKISALRIGLAGQRLFYITNYSGVDPEVRYADNVDPLNPNILAPGIDRRNNYFRTRSFNLQVNVTF